jgi:hypothetical protein
MGFPNVDKYLVKLFFGKFAAAKADGGFAINDTFDDLDAGEIAEITAYISRKIFTSDLRKRDDGQVYILPHFPLLDMPLPQIGISLGQESTADRFLDDVAGDSTPYPASGTQTHWDIPKVYFGAATYRIDVVTATKDEAIWLARLTQRFICEEQDDMAGIGIFEIDITLADLKLEQEHLPLTVFNRAVQINCKVQNSWTKRVPISNYVTGANIQL